MELAGESVEGAGLLHGIEVSALEVLNDGDLHGLLVGDLAEDGGDGGLAGALRGEPATLAGDELEAATSQAADEDGLNDTIGADAGGELFELVIGEAGAGLEGIAVDLGDGDFAGLAGIGGRIGHSGGCCGGGAGQKGVESLAEGAAFGVNNGVHGQSSLNVSLPRKIQNRGRRVVLKIRARTK